MTDKKSFFHDRTALLLASGNIFLTCILIVFVWLKLVAGGTDSSYFISYRPSLGIGARQVGSASDILSFLIFGVLVLGISMVLAQRSYAIKRELSVAILALTLPVLTFLLVVVYLLLALH